MAIASGCLGVRLLAIFDIHSRMLSKFDDAARRKWPCSLYFTQEESHLIHSPFIAGSWNELYFALAYAKFLANSRWLETRGATSAPRPF